MRNSLSRAIACVSACCAVLLAAPVSQAEELQRVTIRVSADIPGPPFPTALAMERFKELVEEAFPEGSEVRNFYAGSLYKDADAMAALSEGNLEMGWLLAGKTASVDSWLGMVVQPGVLTTVAAVHELENLETGKMLLERLRERHNIEPFGFSDLSFSLGIAGKNRLLALDSMQGSKIRTFAPAINPAVESWGANPVVMGFGDVPSALESGVLDGVVTSIGAWRSISEQTPYFTIAGIGTITFDSYWVGASGDWWAGLNEPTRNKLAEFVAEAMQFHDELSWCNDRFSIEAFAAKTLSDPGIYAAGADEARPLQEAIGTNVAEFLKKDLPDEADTWIDRYLEEGREASKRLGPGTDPLEKLDCAQYRDMLKG
ncbi:TRAP transporter substrate-binding protein [Microbaculum sp. FT89]|uniref:TRAP transporter substrate-binding protein n=1 Tax=Microbaculum sp. FT89 TaxID=3447298 RepID=UPI003F536C00